MLYTRSFRGGKLLVVQNWGTCTVTNLQDQAPSYRLSKRGSSAVQYGVYVPARSCESGKLRCDLIYVSACNGFSNPAGLLEMISESLEFQILT